MFKTSKKYYIHDNGGRPFLVYVFPKKNNNIMVIIYSQLYDENKNDYDKNFVKTYYCEQVFIGKSPLNKMTEFSGGHGKNFDGNSILLKIANKKYVFIGWEIYEFQSHYEIMEYVSPVGNSDVPYPYAYDGYYYYLMLDNICVIGKKIKPLLTKFIGEDPYTFYYGHLDDKLLDSEKIDREKDCIKFNKKLVHKRL